MQQIMLLTAKNNAKVPNHISICRTIFAGFFILINTIISLWNLSFKDSLKSLVVTYVVIDSDGLGLNRRSLHYLISCQNMIITCEYLSCYRNIIRIRILRLMKSSELYSGFNNFICEFPPAAILISAFSPAIKYSDCGPLRQYKIPTVINSTNITFQRVKLLSTYTGEVLKRKIFPLPGLYHLKMKSHP